MGEVIVVHDIVAVVHDMAVEVVVVVVSAAAAAVVVVVVVVVVVLDAHLKYVIKKGLRVFNILTIEWVLFIYLLIYLYMNILCMGQLAHTESTYTSPPIPAMIY